MAVHVGHFIYLGCRVGSHLVQGNQVKGSLDVFSHGPSHLSGVSCEPHLVLGNQVKGSHDVFSNGLSVQIVGVESGVQQVKKNQVNGKIGRLLSEAPSQGQIQSSRDTLTAYGKTIMGADSRCMHLLLQWVPSSKSSFPIRLGAPSSCPLLDEGEAS